MAVEQAFGILVRFRYSDVVWLVSEFLAACLVYRPAQACASMQPPPGVSKLYRVGSGA